MYLHTPLHDTYTLHWYRHFHHWNEGVSVGVAVVLAVTLCQRGHWKAAWQNAIRLNDASWSSRQQTFRVDTVVSKHSIASIRTGREWDLSQIASLTQAIVAMDCWSRVAAILSPSPANWSSQTPALHRPFEALKVRGKQMPELNYRELSILDSI